MSPRDSPARRERVILPHARRTALAPNWNWITSELAVGGAFPIERAENLARDHRIRAVVDLRVEACDDAEALARHGLAFLHLPTEDLGAVSQPMLDEGVAFVNCFAGERVLIHCEHGIGRSAILALCVLVSRGHAPLDALELAKSRRARVSPSPVQYEAWIAWMERWRDEHGFRWTIPDFDAFKTIAYRHLKDAV